jgi:chromosome segregation ATPase
VGILDQVVDGIGRELTKIQSRSEEMLHIHNLKSQIRTLEGRCTALLIEIGRMVFDKYQRNVNVGDEAFISKTQELSSLEHDITSLRSEIDAMRGNTGEESPHA